jgi:hypothetical protein
MSQTLSLPCGNVTVKRCDLDWLHSPSITLNHNIYLCSITRRSFRLHYIIFLTVLIMERLRSI